MATNTQTYMNDHSDAVLTTHGWRTVANSVSYVIPFLRPDMRILDVGCGPGSITVDLARLVPQGSVTGIEYIETPLGIARAFAASQGMSNVDFAVGDVHELAYPDDSFDMVHAHQVLQHVRDPVLALHEMRRVTKPGGIVAVRESAAMVWYPKLEGLRKWHDVHQEVARAMGSTPSSGDRLHAWAKQAGFAKDNIECSAGTWCFASGDDKKMWGMSMRARCLESGFAKNAVGGGYCEQEDLEEMAKAWSEWLDDEDGWFSILHGQVICHK
ncbi:S-adenosyl-L-methionine-dependent methyltransferase [Fistulina hepatica ATCC 64428]|uniref:S-adenosyl-L-methionine-dependent methyltransferase n=1 Tax=Fistulina hepatica ATCC 64428 TaxID=1128425 RepID=A0A0D7A2N4_9AGAR|nr:S-adenosyl-L-methionine-dependent methyltransferase [Fistulina hepatica ATCC 64428]